MLKFYLFAYIDIWKLNYNIIYIILYNVIFYIMWFVCNLDYINKGLDATPIRHIGRQFIILIYSFERLFKVTQIMWSEKINMNSGYMHSYIYYRFILETFKCI